MKPLSSIEIKLCQKQAKIFELSIDKTEYSSPIFIRRFMYSSIAKSFDNKLYLFTTESESDAFETLNDEFGKSSYGKEKFSKDQMFWIGYIYRCLCIKYSLSSKAVYKLFKANEIVKYYNICHTFDIVDAAERMMESIDYDTSTIEEKAYKIFKKIMYQEKLQQYLGKAVNVVVDRPIGFNHNGIIYSQNYGYIKDLKAPDNEYQNAYIVGVKKPLKVFEGKVIAIINRTNDNEDKLVISNSNRKFTEEQIYKMVNFQEKYYKSKIIMS